MIESPMCGRCGGIKPEWMKLHRRHAGFITTSACCCKKITPECPPLPNECISTSASCPCPSADSYILTFSGVIACAGTCAWANFNTAYKYPHLNFLTASYTLERCSTSANNCRWSYVEEDALTVERHDSFPLCEDESPVQLTYDIVVDLQMNIMSGVKMIRYGLYTLPSPPGQCGTAQTGGPCHAWVTNSIPISEFRYSNGFIENGHTLCPDPDTGMAGTNPTRIARCGDSDYIHNRSHATDGGVTIECVDEEE